MERKLRYSLRTTPGEILEIARNRIEGYPSAVISGNLDRGTFHSRTMQVEYSMKPGNGGTVLTLVFLKTPPVPWTLVKSYVDREARQW